MCNNTRNMVQRTKTIAYTIITHIASQRKNDKRYITVKDIRHYVLQTQKILQLAINMVALVFENNPYAIPDFPHLQHLPQVFTKRKHNVFRYISFLIAILKTKTNNMFMPCYKMQMKRKIHTIRQRKIQGRDATARYRWVLGNHSFKLIFMIPLF